MKTSGFQIPIPYYCASVVLGLALAPAVSAQFKEIPPAPYPVAVARQKIRSLIGSADSVNRQPTIDTISGLLVWYRDVVDDELIAAWKGDRKTNLPALITPLADARVASAIVDSSWREQREAAFTLAYAPLLGELMARYPASAEPFLHDLLGPAASGDPMPDVSWPEAYTICRILLDMPDTGNWKKTALRILPYFRLAAQNLLLQDLHSSNREKASSAQFWMTDLKIPVPGSADDRQKPRSTPPPQPPPYAVASRAAAPGPITYDTGSNRPHIVSQPSAPVAASESTVASSPSSGAAPFPFPWTGPASGTLKCTGGPIPPNAEYIFQGMPPGNLQVEMDRRIWQARLAPDAGQTQTLILKNISSNPQKRCTLQWKLMP